MALAVQGPTPVLQKETISSSRSLGMTLIGSGWGHMPILDQRLGLGEQKMLIGQA